MGKNLLDRSILRVSLSSLFFKLPCLLDRTRFFRPVFCYPFGRLRPPGILADIAHFSQLPARPPLPYFPFPPGCALSWCSRIQ